MNDVAIRYAAIASYSILSGLLIGCATMKESAKTEIQDLETLERTLSRSEVTVHFELPPGVSCDERTMATAMVVRVGSEVVADGPFVAFLKVKVAEAIETIPREANTVLRANGMLAIGSLGGASNSKLTWTSVKRQSLKVVARAVFLL